MESRHKVLIVDDDPAVLELYRDLMGQLPSSPEIFTTTSGARALAMLKSEPFRLLLCDLKMPKMDGLQVLTIVRRRFPELRTVVMTAVHNEEFRSRAYALGVDLFWLKPDTQQNMEMFLQCIESLLGRDEEGGFRGVQSKSLMDLIQMECLSQSSTVLRITQGSLTGRIWISSGELIDAETDGARGEHAFRRILEWKSGTFENLPTEPNRERTITKPANALLLEAAQAMDEVAAPEAQSPEDVEQADHRKTVWRLASLTKAGANFVVALPNGPDSKAEGWGTEATQEFGTWMQQALETCQKLSRDLQAGELTCVEGRSLDHRIVLLPKEDRSYLVGWPPEAKTPQPGEASKQLIAAWDS
jgi:CheY-like chemotaxis protein